MSVGRFFRRVGAAWPLRALSGDFAFAPVRPYGAVSGSAQTRAFFLHLVLRLSARLCLLVGCGVPGARAARIWGPILPVGPVGGARVDRSAPPAFLGPAFFGAASLGVAG